MTRKTNKTSKICLIKSFNKESKNKRKLITQSCKQNTLLERQMINYYKIEIKNRSRKLLNLTLVILEEMVMMVLEVMLVVEDRELMKVMSILVLEVIPVVEKVSMMVDLMPMILEATLALDLRITITSPKIEEWMPMLLRILER